MVIDGQVDVFRLIKRNSEVHSYQQTAPVTTQVEIGEPSSGQLELGNGYGDRIKSMFFSQQFPCVFGEESVVLGIRNPFSYVARTHVVVLQFSLVPLFKILGKTSARTVLAFK